MNLTEALAASTITNYTTAFQTAMTFILPHEVEFEHGDYGDYDHIRTENVAGDNGGATRYGVDAESHPGIDVDNLDLDAALAIYWSEWQKHECDLLPDKLGIAAFDVWVNGGHANVWLQHAYNETNAPEDEALAEDGNLGPASIAALAACDQDAVLRVFLEQRQARFATLARKLNYAQFLDGWTNRNEDLAALLA